MKGKIESAYKTTTGIVIVAATSAECERADPIHAIHFDSRYNNPIRLALLESDARRLDGGSKRLRMTIVRERETFPLLPLLLLLWFF